MNTQKSAESALFLALVGVSFLGAYMFLLDFSLVLLYPHVRLGDCVSEQIERKERVGEEICSKSNFPLICTMKKTKYELQNWRIILDWAITIWFLLLVFLQTVNIYYLQDSIDKLTEEIKMENEPESTIQIVKKQLKKHLKMHYPLFLVDTILVLFFSYVSIVGDLPILFCLRLLIPPLLCHVTGFLAVLKCLGVLEPGSVPSSDIELSDISAVDSSTQHI